MRGAKIGGRVFRTVKRPELRGVAVAAEDEVGASGSTIFTLAVLASSLNSWPLLGSMASWTWRASCNLSSEEARPPRAATSPTFTGSLSLDLARLLANFNILSQSHFTAPSSTEITALGYKTCSGGSQNEVPRCCLCAGRAGTGGSCVAQVFRVDHRPPPPPSHRARPPCRWLRRAPQSYLFVEKVAERWIRKVFLFF